MCRGHAGEVGHAVRLAIVPSSPPPPADAVLPGALVAGCVLEGAQLEAMLPHRYPFLLVDRIRVVTPGREVVGTKRVSAGEWWCDPGNPAMVAMPFSLVIEALAQTTCALVQEGVDGARGAIAYFVGADRVRFRGVARPGDALQLAVTLRSWRRGICRTHGVATVDGRVVASASLTTIVRAAG